MPPKPERVEPGQLWRDTDERTVHDEMIVEAIVGAGEVAFRDEAAEDVERMVADVLSNSRPTEYAVVRRRPGGFLRTIATARMLETDAHRGYEYLGRSR